MALPTERNSFEKQLQKISKSQSDDILHQKEGYAKDFCINFDNSVKDFYLT